MYMYLDSPLLLSCSAVETTPTQQSLCHRTNSNHQVKRNRRESTRGRLPLRRPLEPGSHLKPIKKDIFTKSYFSFFYLISGNLTPLDSHSEHVSSSQTFCVCHSQLKLVRPFLKIGHRCHSSVTVLYGSRSRSRHLGG